MLQGNYFPRFICEMIRTVLVFSISEKTLAGYLPCRYNVPNTSRRWSIKLSIRDWRDFIKVESSSGIILLAAAVLAIICDNYAPLSHYYDQLLNVTVVFKFGILEMTKPLLLWVNDGLMSIFFLLVGMEIKREICEGELNTLKKAVLPGIAAIGGVIVPALIYTAMNFNNLAAMQGWAIPTATDIAFSLGILALLRSRIPVSLKVFLTAVAIFDDISAIIIIAIFYTSTISAQMLLAATALTLLLLMLNRFNVTKIMPYVIIGMFLWFCILKSGIHATLAGVIVAFAIPAKNKKKPFLSPLRYLERQLHPWIAFAVLPLFAFVNAGINLGNLNWKDITDPITIGIAAGLFFGKQIGVWLASWLAIKFRWAEMPQGANFKGIYGVSLIAGVGFTMSLFIGSLAFSNNAAGHYAELVRLGVISGSVLAGTLGYLVLRFNHPLKLNP